jgi:hypothetical protein
MVWPESSILEEMPAFVKRDSNLWIIFIYLTDALNEVVELWLVK